MNKTLLPPGCYDVLPPYARREFVLLSRLLAVFESFGYAQASPPLLEYSDSLLSGRGAALSPQIFRVMDPAAHKVMGIRADITLQIARLAQSRLAHAPRPLRLCYHGVILRLQGENGGWGDRQLQQAGIELIGAASPEADAEVILVAAEALKAAGIAQFTIDLNLPGIVGALLSDEKLDNEQAESLLAAVAQKDVSALKPMAFRYRDALMALLQCAGPAQAALAVIETLDLPEAARRQCRDLQAVVALLQRHGAPEWSLTIDAAEHRGLDYHSGISFSFFAPGAAREVGRGGRYRSEGAEATGFTLYVETLSSLLPDDAPEKRVFIAGGIGDDAAHLREQGYATVYAIAEFGADEEEARRLDCGFIYRDGKLTML